MKFFYFLFQLFNYREREREKTKRAKDILSLHYFLLTIEVEKSTFKL